MSNSTLTLRKLASFSLRSIWLSLLILTVDCGIVWAQRTATDGSTPLALSPGAPAGSFAVSGFETVNAYNGSLSFRLPLLQIGGRGSAGYTLSLPLTAHWRTVHRSNDQQTIDIPVLSWWNLAWRPYGAGQLQGRVGTDSDHPCPPLFHVTTLLSRLTFTAPDGTEYELRDQLTNGKPQTYFCGGGQPYPSRGTVFVTSDGTAATFISDSTILDDGSVSVPSGYLSLRDGTRYRIVRGDVTWMRDRNGNQLNFAYAAYEMTVTDSLNRQVRVAYADFLTRFYDEISYRGYGGAARTIRVNYAPLQNALRTNRPGDLSAVQNRSALFPQITNPNAETEINPYVTASVVLPDGVRQYQFLYNVYGELARVTLPTGGAFEYDFGNGSNYSDPTGVIWTSNSLPEIYRRILRRRVYLDQGFTLESLTTYSRPEIDTPGYVEVNHFKSDQTTLLARERHYFYGTASASFSQGALDYSPWRDGKEYQTDYFAANGQTLLKRVTQTWAQRAVSWWIGPSDTAPPNNPYVTDVVTLLADTGQVSKTTHINPQTGAAMFDQFNNVIDTWVYDYSKVGLGRLLNHTHTDYLTVNNGIDYSARTSLSSPHLLSLPTRQSVHDSLEIERSRTTYEYDNYTPSDNFHAALKDWPAITGVAISGLDPSYTPAFLFRGNVTAATRYFLAINQVSGSVKEYAQFDIAGNVVRTIDPRSSSTNIIATTINYEDCFGAPDAEARTNNVPDRLLQTGQRTYAFPTLTTTALGHKTYLQFDYYVSRPVDAEDANGTLYSGFYDDPFERPTKILKAGNRDLKFQSLTLFSYDDANRVITTNGDLRSYGDQVLQEQLLYDGLGRTVETRQFEGGGNFIAARRGYDALGRTRQSSNPFRPWKGENPVWNITAFDGLGRVESTTTADGASTATSYNGNEVLATDQIGKKRKSVADALGRMVQVYEDPNGVNWLTSYDYDALGNLTSVNQGNQVRSFQYDSLSRLVSANNPESGSSAFTFDNAGNLLTRIDGRGIVTTINYDKLSRPVSRTYQNDPSSTPPVNYVYDAQPLPGSAPPGFARGSSSGKLVAVIYGNASSTGDYFSFDFLGRAVRKVQRTGNVNYESVAEYNVSSRAISLTYPSGHIVSFNYDSAGRLGDRSPSELALSGNLAGVTRTYASGLSYSNRNALAQEKLGTDTPIYNKLFYNARGQLAEIRDSTSPNNTSWNRGAVINHYSNACWGMCAGLNMPDNNGNLKKQDHWIPDSEQGYPYQTLSQSFHYDDLNRLVDVSETRYVNDINPTLSFTQAYSYDRYGNRAINQAGTTQNGGINTSRAAVAPNTVTNRIYGPGESESNHPLINYDAVGNQTKDYYSGNGIRYDRAFDAEGRLISSLAGDVFGNQTSTYGYDGSSARVRRTVKGQETWLVYGIGDELLAEYPANAVATQPTKEYGYRNGQLLIVATVGTTEPPISNGPVGYWKFDENSGNTTADASGNGHPGTLVGANWTPGQTGSAAGLDGLDDFVQVGAQSTLTMTSAATLSAWIYPTGSGSNSNYGGTILGKEGEYLINRAANGNIQWIFSNSNPGWSWVNTGAVAPLNQWTHVAVTYDAGVVKTYVNGVLVHTFSGSGPIVDYDGGAYNDFRIGGRQESVQHFQGRIDEVRTYNRSLPASEISILVGIQTSGLIGSWNFDEGSGNTTADGSGIGFNGTMMSGATWATGHSNSAASFDGVNDYVQVGAQAGLSATSAVSLSAWIFPTGPGSNPTYGGTIMGKEGEYLVNRAPNGNIQWVISNSNPGWVWVNTGGVAPLNQWTHVAVTYDAGLVKTYVNGVLVHTFSGSGSIVDYDGGAYNDFRIGGRQESVQHFQGRIDEVRAYNRPLAANEISTLVNTQLSGLIGSWNFDEGSGNTTVDASGKGFNGTLMSGATWATGHSNSAASFDGVNDYVQVGAQAGLSVTSAVSLSAWIFPTGPGSNSTYGGTIMGKEGEYLVNRAPNGNIQWVISNSNPGWVWVNTGGVAPLNQWTHVAVTYDAGLVKTYVNGVLVHTFSGSGSIVDFDGGAYNDFRIGGRQESVQYFQGRIDQVRVFNRALSTSEIATVQASAVAATERDTGETPVPRNTANSTAEILWLVADQLGTPRMIFDKSGSLSNMKRHDYLPFGEELSAGVGQRSVSQGYGSADGVRQKFTSKERDSETSLDYFLARHYQNAHGRFISPDPLLASGRPAIPQSWNRYAYVLNNPLKFVDPSGLEEREQTLPGQTEQQQSQQPQPSPSPVQPPATPQPEPPLSPGIPLTQLIFGTMLADQPGTTLPLDQAANDILNTAVTQMANNDLTAMGAITEMQLHPGTGSSMSLSLQLHTGESSSINWTLTKVFYVHSPDEVLLQTGLANRNIQSGAAAALIPIESQIADCTRRRLGDVSTIGGGNMAAALGEIARNTAQKVALNTFQVRFSANPPPQALPR